MREICKSGSMRGNSGTGICAIHCSLLYRLSGRIGSSISPLSARLVETRDWFEFQFLRVNDHMPDTFPVPCVGHVHEAVLGLDH